MTLSRVLAETTGEENSVDLRCYWYVCLCQGQVGSECIAAGLAVDAQGEAERLAEAG